MYEKKQIIKEIYKKIIQNVTFKFQLCYDVHNS